MNKDHLVTLDQRCQLSLQRCKSASLDLVDHRVFGAHVRHEAAHRDFFFAVSCQVERLERLMERAFVEGADTAGHGRH